MKLDRKDMKRINRNTIFQYIRSREHQVVSCVQISRDTKISLPTVLKHVDYFEKLNILKGIGTQEVSGAGRKPTLLEFVPEAFCTLGVAFDGKYLECVCVNLNYEVLYSRRAALTCTIHQLLAQEIPVRLEEFIADCGIAPDAIISIGLALPAAVDPNRYQTTTPSPLIGLGANHDFKEQFDGLTARFGCPVLIENDVNAAAIGEFKERLLTSRDDLVYITLGTGIGSGIVLNGKIRRGKNFAAGEIANFIFGDALHHEGATAEALLTPGRILSQFHYNIYEPPCPEGEVLRIRVADYIARHLAGIIMNMESVLNVNYFVLGGFVTEHLGDSLLEFLHQYLSTSGFGHLDITPVSSLFATSKGAGSLASDKALDYILTRDDAE